MGVSRRWTGEKQKQEAQQQAPLALPRKFPLTVHVALPIPAKAPQAQRPRPSSIVPAQWQGQ